MYFNPRSHERSDPCQSLCISFRIYFNPRSHERSDLICSTSYFPVNCISIHAPTRGATSGFSLITKFTYISIHAPTRGATASSASVSPGSNISIHAPTRGATHNRHGCAWHQIFQSTLPREERRFMRPDHFSHHVISIHAPTRGATV